MIKILVVDDDKNIRYFIKETLELKNYQVFCAKDAYEAYSIYEKEHLDLVIVDIMMPGIDGYEFTKSLRIANENILILMISAKQLSLDRQKGFLSGIDDYMAKPIDPDELVLHIRALLHRAKLNNDKKLIIGNLVLDTEEFSIKDGSTVYDVSPKEFQLLYKLLSYPKKIFTSIQLMDEIWGYDCDSGLETITVHIGRLRKKFENCPYFELITGNFIIDSNRPFDSKLNSNDCLSVYIHFLYSFFTSVFK